MPSNFIIISHGRTGSTLLVKALNVNPDVCCASELFGPPNQKHPNDAIVNYTAGPGDVFLQTFYSLNICPAMGFKIFTFHARANSEASKAWDYLISDKNIKCIFLRRENLLAAYISELRARETGQWQPSPMQQEDHLSTEKIIVDPERAKKYISQIEIQMNRARDDFSDHDVLEISYEELQSDIENLMLRLSDFLNIKYVKSGFQFYSLLGSNYLDLIANREEIVQVFGLNS